MRRKAHPEGAKVTSQTNEVSEFNVGGLWPVNRAKMK